ncbi:MAG: biopolymer transporter ExbD [Zetaproteobacteria bacterium CG_4_9_14_3_um_filter_49_83]|nr:MAG: biopolymer transporter ExbD [Zetaproteobacteria bacterium CG1_02_49_23]PIQ31520.1 MAG: biopolymer transporter ExbD [Zetaproteobacteria bacterium CG17_big_fil_post_rev_8_21_14_2_50_50_13]PIV29691.1 MAG: biopolymer transporter ExbD [Zetaproteobacteria bacterium CG02_land_8_20_14_3_00_50_9]PIY54601.1 MAG: biopolymer transporter ExbD [Zetaproteobacteria bacterium CG_4_10_14_0_8_um_filter_49_80]PJA35670.1 MAG: biopolymer transporter ExbD [Zetaproteobacteria bacterium CG_4_9_14_3_um_filter_49
MNLRNRKKVDFMVDMTPLVDVVFLMLIFFMISTSFTVSNSLKLDLPNSRATQQAQEDKKVVISIDANGGLFVQDEAVQDGDLRRRILNISKGDPTMRIVLRADADARHKRVVYVLDTVRELGMGKIGIATMPYGQK